MKTIYCVMGKSGSGKDSIGKEIRALSGMGELQACTTRPMRAGETEGKPYHFIKEEQVRDEMICSTLFYREDGSYYYGFTNCDLDESIDHVAIVNPSQVCEIKERYGNKFRIVCIYIQTDEEIRILHVIEREEAEEKPDYKELCRRFRSDYEDFSDENEIMKKVHRISDEVIPVLNDYEIPAKEIAMEVLKCIRR